MQEREARRLATKVSKAFTFCPPIDVWVESLLPLEHPDHVEHAITRLVQSSDTGKEIGVGAVLGEYWRLVRRNVPDTGPGCRVCDRTGVTHVEKPSPVSGFLTTYVEPCSSCDGAGPTLERVRRWNAGHRNPESDTVTV